MPIKHADFGLNVLKYTFLGEKIYTIIHIRKLKFCRQRHTRTARTHKESERGRENNLSFEELHSENVFVFGGKKSAANAAKSLQQKETMLILDAWTMATWFIIRLSFQNTHYFGWRKKWNLNRAHACAKPSVIIFQKLWRVYFSLWKTTLNLAYRDKCFTIMLIPFLYRVLYKNTEMSPNFTSRFRNIIEDTDVQVEYPKRFNVVSTLCKRYGIQFPYPWQTARWVAISIVIFICRS